MRKDNPLWPEKQELVRKVAETNEKTRLKVLKKQLPEETLIAGISLTV